MCHHNSTKQCKAGKPYGIYIALYSLSCTGTKPFVDNKYSLAPMWTTWAPTCHQVSASPTLKDKVWQATSNAEAQQWPACNVALLTCSVSAAWLGGRFSICRLFFVNRCFRMLSTLSLWLVRSYIRITKRSTAGMCLVTASVSGLQHSWMNVDVTSGNKFQVSQAPFLPCPRKLEVVSQPVIEWKIGRALQRSEPRGDTILWTAMYLHLVPTPNAIHSWSRLSDINVEIANTTTSDHHPFDTTFSSV